MRGATKRRANRASHGRCTAGMEKDMGWGFSMLQSLTILFYVKLWLALKAKCALFARTLNRSAAARISCADLFYWHAAASEHAAQIPDRREHFVVPIRALRIVGALFMFNDVLILAENILSEPR